MSAAVSKFDTGRAADAGNNSNVATSGDTTSDTVAIAPTDSVISAFAAFDPATENAKDALLKGIHYEHVAAVIRQCDKTSNDLSTSQYCEISSNTAKGHRLIKPKIKFSPQQLAHLKFKSR